MSAPRIAIDEAMATRLVQRHLDPDLRVTRVEKLHGGMIAQVRVFHTTGEPKRVVAKIHLPTEADAFRREMGNLQYYRQHTELPVPIPYAVIEPSKEDPVAGLLLEYLDGPNLADARVSPRGMKALQRQLARHVARLHEHRREHYGSPISDEHYHNWLDVFGPRLRKEYESVRSMLRSRDREVIDRVMANLERWLPEFGEPTLIHGDLWSTNILVDDRHADEPEVLAFIDCHPAFCDREYELAYLQIFHTVEPPFFEVYHRTHPPRDGFERRCRVYWLHTMLLHVRIFGDRYLPPTTDVVRQLEKLGA